MASDKWILSELAKLVERSMAGYREFDFFIPANEIRDFVWETFASHYLEMVKPRAYGQGFTKSQQRAAWCTLHRVLKTILLLLAPLIPYMADYVWRQLYSKQSVHIEGFPKPAWSRAYSKYTEQVLSFNREVWKIKEERNLTLRDSLEMNVPKDLKPFETDLIRMHSLTQKA